MEYGASYDLSIHCEGCCSPQPPPTENWLAMCCLFPAMQCGESLHIAGRVDYDVLQNLAELNVIWNTWKPDVYYRIELSADVVLAPVSPPSGGKGHVFAYSGGVDAMAALLRHSEPGLGWRRRAVGAALIVHGFDIPLTDHLAWQVATDSSQRVLDELGVQLLRLRTNLRELPHDWNDCFVLALAGVANAVGAGFDGLVYGSDSRDYESPIIPWGSNPIGDRWCSSVRFPAFADGCEMSRADKLAVISNFQDVGRYLRVCWQTSAGGRNCGLCEKCLRTQLMFLASGLDIPECFLRRISPGDLRGIRLTKTSHEKNMSDVVALAEANNLNEWWLSELRDLLRRERRRRSRRLVDRVFRRVARAVGYDA